MNPYLSIVVTSRNDNHGGDLNLRTSLFLESIYYQAEKWKLEVEVIIVEWNPPEDKPLLKNVLPKPYAGSKTTLRFIVVPESIHNTYNNGSTLPLFQMIAKNVGIRRAKGVFVLCTNVDIVFSDENFEIIANKQFEKGKFYRANRCDVPKDVLEIKETNKILTYCKRNIISRFGVIQNNEVLNLVPFNIKWVYTFPKLAKWLNTRLTKYWQKRNGNIFPHIKIDFDACGDYTLMSKEDWLDIEGYVELDMYSIHIDSMALWAAIALNKEQQILPFDACVYHIDHDNGWESNDVRKTIKFLENKPCLDYSIVYKGGIQILQQGEHWKLNPSTWGFTDKNFKEFIFTADNQMQELN